MHLHKNVVLRGEIGLGHLSRRTSWRVRSVEDFRDYPPRSPLEVRFVDLPSRKKKKKLPAINHGGLIQKFNPVVLSRRESCREQSLQRATHEIT